MSQFVVIGLDRFGCSVATTLSGLGHNVLVIDSDKRKIEEIKDRVTQAVVCDATEKRGLREFVNETIDAAVVCIGYRMDESILTTLHLKDLGVKKIIVKAVSNEHGRVLEAIGATEIIYPEKDVGVRVAERMDAPNLIDHIPLVPGYSIVELAVPDSFVGKTLRELKLRNKYGIEVIAVKDLQLSTFNLIPSADLELKPKISLIVIAKRKDICRLTV
jgi:trk system potassium uptake protein TrkA